MFSWESYLLFNEIKNGASMKKSNESLSEIKLVGILARTSNSLEANPETAKIGRIIGNYFENNCPKLNQKIKEDLNSDGLCRYKSMMS